MDKKPKLKKGFHFNKRDKLPGMRPHEDKQLQALHEAADKKIRHLEDFSDAELAALTEKLRGWLKG